MTENENRDERAQGEGASPAAPAPRKHKRGITVAVVVVAVLVVAGCGMLAWHETPSFCGTVCHTPMSTYLDTYEATPNTQGVDAYGNEVSNTNSMLAVVHASAGQGCMRCHEPSLDQQMSEGMAWVSGNYEYPLPERSVNDLMVDSGKDGGSEAFCLKSGCHDAIGITSRDDLEQATVDMPFNPHTRQHGDIDCGTCHKAHRASTLYCTQCHAEAVDELPAGWVTYQDSQAQIAEM